MEQFSTEEQQVEAIKSFWKENGLAIVGGAILGLGGMIGWRMYSDAMMTSQETNSEHYVDVVSVQQPSTDNLISFAEEGKGTYSSLAALTAAKIAVEDNDLEAAANYLETATNVSDGHQLKALATLRLARVQFQQGSTDKALQTVSTIESSLLVAQVQELKGDIYSSLGDVEQAKLAYEQALSADESNRFLQMKIDNVSISPKA